MSIAPPGHSAVGVEAAAGLVYEGPFGRDKDQVGLGVSSVRVGQPLGSGALASRSRFHGYETAVESSYQAQVTPWLQMQPDVQYIADPGGGIPDPSRPGRSIRSAVVLVVRTIAAF